MKTYYSKALDKKVTIPESELAYTDTKEQTKVYRVYEYDFVEEINLGPIILETTDYAAAITRATELAKQWCEDEYPAEVEMVDGIGVAGEADFGAVVREVQGE